MYNLALINTRSNSTYFQGLITDQSKVAEEQHQGDMLSTAGEFKMDRKRTKGQASNPRTRLRLSTTGSLFTTPAPSSDNESDDDYTVENVPMDPAQATQVDAEPKIKTEEEEAQSMECNQR